MSVLGKFGRSLLAGRQRQANKVVYSTLLGFDDETIRAAGHTRAELQRRSIGAIFF
jgi:hypothetical protein